MIIIPRHRVSPSASPMTGFRYPSRRAHRTAQVRCREGALLRMRSEKYSQTPSRAMTLVAISRQEFYAACLAATPNDFAWLALRVIRHQRQSEPVPDIERRICHDLGAARRYVQDEALELR